MAAFNASHVDRHVTDPTLVHVQRTRCLAVHPSSSSLKRVSIIRRGPGSVDRLRLSITVEQHRLQSSPLTAVFGSCSSNHPSGLLSFTSRRADTRRDSACNLRMGKHLRPAFRRSPLDFPPCIHPFHPVSLYSSDEHDELSALCEVDQHVQYDLLQIHNVIFYTHNG
jgi:hypothetical protein